MFQSVSTIDSPEFINLQPLDINPLMSACDIKVLYLGKNRNKTSISKEVAMEMAKTLRGAPIVGYYKEEAKDFRDHGHEVIIDGDGIKFKTNTTPYGFVSPDARVWFQKFEELDEATGKTVIREYMMTTGYLWTGQFEEAKLAINEGRPQSMELEEESLSGNWAKDFKSGIEFFIINDAIFTKLCILGQDVEPCFEGASVTKPEISTTFTKMDDKFTTTLYTMMQELRSALEGGQQNMEEIVLVETVETEPVVEQPEVVEPAPEVEEPIESVPEFVVQQEEEEDEEKETEEEEEPASGEEETDPDEDEEEKKNKYSKLESDYQELVKKYNLLETQHSDLTAQYQLLVEFKNNIENEKKDALINSFYMLSDEDKKDVIENKATYSLDDIEAKLSVICVRKKVSFDVEEPVVSEDQPAVIFSLNDTVDNAPAWIRAVRNTQKSRNL